MYSNEVNALISLIEDPDESIYKQVSSELKNYGESIIPQLEQYWELQDFGPLFQTRLEELISTIQYLWRRTWLSASRSITLLNCAIKCVLKLPCCTTKKN